jgi:ketosteroid isomerase-like protein
MRPRVLVAAGAVLAVLVYALLPVSDEKRIAEAIDDARDALVEHRPEDFLAFFDDPVDYRQGGDRARLARDVDRWVKARIGRVTLLSRDISVTGDTALVALRCDVGNALQSLGTVDVRLLAVKDGEGNWRVRRFDWK